MKNPIKVELLRHLRDAITDRELQDFDDLHHVAFNEDYYIIGHHNAKVWFEKHGVSAWDAIEVVQQWNNDTFGEVDYPNATPINPESMVNMYVYILGEELMSELDYDVSVADMLGQLDDLIKEGNLNEP